MSRRRKLGQWLEVCRADPCPVCAKPDVCMVHIEDPTVACFRTEHGCKRDGAGQPIVFQNGMGWVHSLDPAKEFVPRAVRKRAWAEAEAMDERPTIDCDVLQSMFQHDLDRIDEATYATFCASLGLRQFDLLALGIGWAARYGGWTFPMYDERERIIGFRIRGEQNKYAWPGSRNGVFLAGNFAQEWCPPPYYIVEGPSDAAALLSLGFRVIGRSHNTGNVSIILAALAHRTDDVVIVSDRDGPGRQGAETLANKLKRIGAKKSVKVIEPTWGGKDSRAWVKAGATAGKVRAVTDSGYEWTVTVAA